jgi:hypothetical protein
MNNIEIFKEFWNSYTSVLSKLYDRTNDNPQIEKLEDLIYETKDVFIKNTQQKSGRLFSNLELVEVNKIVDSFIKS